MKKKITIHQPQYLPWLPYFAKIARSNLFVYLDDVQFQKNGYQNRNQIKNANGKQWLTVPVYHDFGQKINEVKITNSVPWRKKHWKALTYSYSRAKFFSAYEAKFRQIYEIDWRKLIDLNLFSTNLIIELLGINVDIVKSSELDINQEGSDRILEICKELSADVYISGAGGRNYIVLEDFQEVGIDVVFQNYNYPVYEQQYPELGFRTNLSIVDLLFNHGPDSLEILLEGNDSS